jgi:predicted DNA-binding transcriptional regulator YafY
MNVKMTPLIDLNLATIELLESGIRQTREITMKYRGLQDRSFRARRVQPHDLYHRNGGWYLAAYDRAKKAFRSFLISRAREWVLTQKPFKRQKDFTVDGFLGGSFGAMSGRGKAEKVRVRLFGAAARLGEERIWHGTQKTESGSRRKDGSIIVSFELRGLDEIRRWILQWEGEAEVLEPLELKDQVKKAGQKIHQRS